jgi:hypothetical protein
MSPFRRELLLTTKQFRCDRDLVEISPFRQRFGKHTDTKCDTRTDSGPLFRRDTEPMPRTRLRELVEAIERRSR